MLRRFALAGLLTLAACGRAPQPLAPASAAPAPAPRGYHYAIDLTARADDRFHIVLTPPPLPAGEAVFHLPATVPGTYEIEDWGRMVAEIRASAADGSPIAIRREGDNRFVIADGQRLSRLTYAMDDSLDAGLRDRVPYAMAATDLGENHAVVNPFGVFGWFDDIQEVPFVTTYSLPPGWKAATALPNERHGDTLTCRARDYDELVDCPVLCGALQTRTLRVAETTIDIAVYSSGPTELDAEVAAREVEPVLHATARWLGTLPVDHYAFLIHSGAPLKGSRGGGAHEHRTSSFYYLPGYAGADEFAHMAAHEFFHIVTPLNLRSDLIDDFDFTTPRPSRHLWFYEGVTEYCSWHLRAKGGLISERQFLGELRTKLHAADGYRWDLPMTELGLGCYDRHAAQYINVYLKGALVAWALDLEIQRLSDGARDLRDTIRTLIKRFGPERPFTEDGWFAAIADAAGEPEVVAFLERYIAGGEVPDFDALLQPLGLRYLMVRDQAWTDSRWPVLMPDGTGIAIWGLSAQDLPPGFAPGDRVVAIDGAPVTASDLPRLAEREAALAAEDVVTVTVQRAGQRVELTCTARAGSLGNRHALRAVRVLDAKQTARRKRWLTYPP